MVILIMKYQINIGFFVEKMFHIKINLLNYPYLIFHFLFFKDIEKYILYLLYQDFYLLQKKMFSSFILFLTCFDDLSF